MKRLTLGIALASLLVLTLLSASLAQRPGRGGGAGWGRGSTYNRMYDPKTVTMVSGKVVAVDRIVPASGMSYGVHLILKTAAETISVHLGPGWYMDAQSLKVAVGDAVQVKGSRIAFNGKPAVIAAEVKKGNAILALRDAAGIPVWAGQGGGRGRP